MKIRGKGFYIVNLDINIIAEKPKISRFVSTMKEKISKLLRLKLIKSQLKQLTEKIGFIGDGEGIVAV